MLSFPESEGPPLKLPLTTSTNSFEFLATNAESLSTTSASVNPQALSMEFINLVNPEPSAQIPFLHGVKLGLVTSLKKGESYYELAEHFPQVIREVEKLPPWMYGNTKRNLTARYLGLDEAGANDPMILDILHTIPRDILSSVVLGTVYYDAIKTKDYPKMYSHAFGIAVYAIGIGVRHRQGKWLAANELTKVIGDMNNYVRAYQAFKKHRGAPTTAGDQALHDLVKRVDSQFGNHDYRKGYVKFVEDDTKLVKIRALVSTLKQRVRMSLKKDPSGTTPMIQTPLYIGCSIQLENRMPDHELTRNLASSNKAYAFTVSVMSSLGYSPVSRVVCVTRLWDLKQLSKAEALVGALAGCYITQEGGGFNRVECGDASGSNTKKPEALLRLESRDAQEYIMSRCGFMHDNLCASVAEMQRRQAYLRDCDSLCCLFQPLGETVEDGIMALESGHQDLELTLKRMILLKAQVDQQCSEAEDERQAMSDEVEIVDLLSQLVLHLKQAAGTETDDSASE